MAHLASHIQNYEVRFLPEFFDSRSNWTDFRVELFAMACSNAAAELLGEALWVWNSKRQLLESKALDFVYPAYSAMLGHLRSKALEDFQVRLEQSLNKGEGFASSVILVLSLLCLSLRKDVQMLPYNKLIGMLQKSGKSFDVI
ncbi:uncharacterized protein [Malus domestica]|uniref:uncharacterized protein isoform X1 n=1 Tax=Malus domestica TaxID=3750 RepID=UPI0039753E9B